MNTSAPRTDECFDQTAMVNAAKDGDFREVLRLQRHLLDELIADPGLRVGDPTVPLERITELVANILRAGRVGVWLFDEHHSKITCADMYIARDARHVSRNVVQRGDAPTYFDAVMTGDVIAADDAYTDRRTCEFAEGYLPAFGIGAMLDVPVFQRRRLIGVMCIEHIGGARKWEGRERLLAGSLADCAGMILAESSSAESSSRWRQLAG